MPNYDKLAAQAKKCGFTHSAPLDVATLEYRQDIRDMCNAQQCNKYGTNWSCPPVCKTLEEIREQAKAFTHGLLVQTVGDLEDSYDWEGITETGKRHKTNFAKLWGELKKDHETIFAMGAGECKLCQTCTYPDNPCRHPDRMEISMEACGLYVSEVCKDNNLKYNYGPNKIAFTSCYLLP